MNIQAVKQLAPDLNREFPRSPHELMGGFVIVARAVDKGRAELAGTLGEYKYHPCGLFQTFLDFTGIDPDALKDAIATGADDAALGRWIMDHSKVTDPDEIAAWNERMRTMKIADLPEQMRDFIAEYAAQNLPRPVTVWFDMFDLEEGRID